MTQSNINTHDGDTKPVGLVSSLKSAHTNTQPTPNTHGSQSEREHVTLESEMESYGATAILDHFAPVGELANPMVSAALQHRRHERHVKFLERVPVRCPECRRTLRSNVES